MAHVGCPDSEIQRHVGLCMRGESKLRGPTCQVPEVAVVLLLDALLAIMITIHQCNFLA